MDVRAAERLLVDRGAHAGALDDRRAARHHLALALEHHREMRGCGLDRAQAGARPHRDGRDRDHAELLGHQPGRVAGDLGAAHLLDQAHAAAGALDEADQRQAVLERVVLGVDPLVGYRRVGGPAADREVVDVERDLAPADPGGTDDGVGRRDLLQAPVGVVLGFSGEHADLEPRAGIDQRVDALAGGEAPLVVLAADGLGAAEFQRELAAFLDLVDFRLPRHAERLLEGGRKNRVAVHDHFADESTIVNKVKVIQSETEAPSARRASAARG